MIAMTASHPNTFRSPRNFLEEPPDWEERSIFNDVRSVSRVAIVNVPNKPVNRTFFNPRVKWYFPLHEPIDFLESRNLRPQRAFRFRSDAGLNLFGRRSLTGDFTFA